MKLIVSCFVSLMLIFNIGLANIVFPNANNLFRDQNTTFIDTVDISIGSGLNTILLAVYKIGYTIAVVATMVLAMKLLLTTPAKKAAVKTALMPYFIGLLLLVAGVPIATKVIQIYTQLL